MAQDWYNKIQTAFEEQASFLIQVATLSLEDRKKLAGNNEANFLGVTDERIMSGIRMFADALSPAQRLQVLRKQEVVQVPVTSLSKDAKAYIDAETQKTGRPDLLSNKVTFVVVRDKEDLSPTLYIDFGFGGHGYVGGIPLDNQMRGDVSADWMQPGDTKDNSLLDRNVKLPMPGEAPQPNSPTPSGRTPKARAAMLADGSLAQRLMQLSDSVPLSVLAVLPQDNETFAAPYDHTVAEYLKTLGERPWQLLNKWHDNILEITYAPWFLQAGDTIPYGIVKKLRTALQKQQNAPDLKILAEATFGMSEKQLKLLQGEFPILSLVTTLRCGFVLLHYYPEIESDKGAFTLTEKMREILQTYNQIDGLALSRASRIRFRKISDDQFKAARRRVVLELLDSEGRMVGGTGQLLPDL